MSDKNKSALSVTDGVKQPSSVNKNAIHRFKKIRKKILPVNEYVKGIKRGDINLLSQAITLIESTNPEHNSIAQNIIEKCLPHSGNSLRIGITGVPGVGKSTFIESFGNYVISQGHKLGVLAIDPSSERSKGSILGDKTRMETLSGNEKAFIRPSPSAGSLGGVARKSRETVILCEAAGFDVILIETVGVGQSETAVHSMVDFFLLLMLAGAGDELQGIKRGIMEMADGIAITKADGTNKESAEMARSEYRNALHLFPPQDSGWSPEVITCSSLTNTGIDSLWNMVLRYKSHALDNTYFQHRRNLQARYWMYEFINEILKNNFYQHPEISKRIKDTENDLQEGKISSFMAAQKLLNIFKQH